MRVLRISHSAVVGAWRERERTLACQGVDVHTLTAQRWNEGGADVPLEPQPGEAVTGVRTWGTHPALFLYDPRPLWRALGEPWDVLDLHEEPFALATAEILLLRALRRQRAPYTLYSAQNLPKRYPVPFRWCERAALQRAAGLSVCNTAAGRICVAKGFPGAPRLIPLGVDLAHFTPAGPSAGWPPAGGRSPAAGPPPSAAHPPARDPAQITVGYAGRLAPHKGVATLLRAVAGAPSLTLRLAGGGPQDAELRALATDLGLAGRVEFTGPLSSAELPAFYRSLDVLAVPSLPTPRWEEQFGRVAVEAMACGVPVVASASGALPEVGVGLFVPPGDPQELRTALLRVGSDPALAAQLRQAGLARAAQYSWGAVAAQHRALYQSMQRLPREAAGLEVVLVAYGAPALVRRALEPLAHLPVTVVDNSSLPEIAAVCESLGVRYRDARRNGGFAAGVNVALADRTPGADVLLLNPDARISAAGVQALQAALRAEVDLASVGPAQVDDAGVPARVGWPFPSPGRTWREALGLGRLSLGRLGLGRLDRLGARPQFVIGSVLLLRAEALDQVGPLDERFFLYAEETDWAHRASQQGWRHGVVAEVTAHHTGAATSADPYRREAHFHASQERYLRKHFGTVGWQVARVGQLVGALLRAWLPRERGAAARLRLHLYAAGPVRMEEVCA